MGIPFDGSADLAINSLEDAFVGIGAGAPFRPVTRGDGPAQSRGFGANGFNVWIWGGFTGSVIPERSFDGLIWLPFCFIDFSSPVWSVPGATFIDEVENGTLWRLRCTAFTSGTINWRLSQ